MSKPIRYSDEIPYEKRKYWYFTTHGIGPGTIPRDLNVLKTKEGINDKGTSGLFICLDGILNTSELEYYDLKELIPPEDINMSLDIDFWYNLSKYCNYNWKGHFSEAELLTYAENIQSEMIYSINSKELSYDINQLLKNLIIDKENGSEEANNYINKIKNELNKHGIIYK